MTMTFTAEELHIIDCALSVAAGIYDQDAERMMAEGHPRTAAQFDRQARQARKIAYDIANRPS